MKKVLSLALGAFTVVLFACGGNSEQAHNEHAGHDHSGHSHNAAATEEKTPLDKLFDEVVALHDEAMPKMGKLRGYQKTAEAKLDSLKTKKDAASLKLRAELEVLLAGLKRADKGMMDWMDSFKVEPDLPSLEEKMAYFEKEKQKAKNMRDDIFSMIDSAAARFGL